MSEDVASLRSEVYQCSVCANSGFGFTRVTPDAHLSKFPPTIGATGPVQLLFVGTNPRLSESNRGLFATLMTNRAAFDALATDVWNGRSYLRWGEPGHHYDIHLAIASGAFPGQLFQKVAAVTELFLCATKDSSTLPTNGSPCADRYLHRVVDLLRPRVIVTVGSNARDYLAGARVAFGAPFSAQVGAVTVLVVPVPHPAGWGAKADAAAYVRWASDVTRLAISGTTNFPPAPRQPMDRSSSRKARAAQPIYPDPGMPDSAAVPHERVLSVRVRSIPPGAHCRTWTLRRDNGAHHHGVVSLTESPLYLDLSWRPDAFSQKSHVGVFRLDLAALLDAGFIRTDPVGSTGPQARLRVVLRNDSRFYIQTKEGAPSLALP